MTTDQYNLTNRSGSFLSYCGDLSGELKNSETILIVDDEEVVRQFHRHCLSPRYKCLEVSSAEEALEILNREQISLVITDWVMPGMSGTSLLRRIVRDFPDTLVVMVTGVNHPERALDAVRSGAFDYLLKPCKPDTLEFTVERALRQRDLSIKARQSKIDLELQNIELVKQKAELERLQIQIIHTEKMASIGRLTAGIAHELNNPLGYISGNLQILEQFFQDIRALLDLYDSVEFPAEHLSEIEKFKKKIHYREMMETLSSVIKDCDNGTQKVAELVENLRVFSKLDQPKFSETDINRDIESVINLLKKLFEKENTNLEVSYGNLPKIEAYAGHLNQVWMNLLLNAAQAVDANGGEVTVATEISDDFVIVRISDTGEGIAPENLNRIFDPFFTTKSIGQGTGLGLSIAHSIVEAHCGSISVKSDWGKNTVFTVRLPVKENDLTEAAINRKRRNFYETPDFNS